MPCSAVHHHPPVRPTHFSSAPTPPHTTPALFPPPPPPRPPRTMSLAQNKSLKEHDPVLYELIQKVRRGREQGRRGVCGSCRVCPHVMSAWTCMLQSGRSSPRKTACVCLYVCACFGKCCISLVSVRGRESCAHFPPSPPPFPSSPFTGEEPPAHLPGADCLGELHLRGGHGVLGLRAHQQGKQRSCCDAVGLLEKERKTMVAPAAGQGVPYIYTPLHLPHSLVPSFLFFFLSFYNPHRPSRRHLSLNPFLPPPFLPPFLPFSTPKASPAPVTTAATKWWTTSRTCAATGPCKPTVWTRRSGA